MGVLDKLLGRDPGRGGPTTCVLRCHLDESHALVFSDIVVTPFEGVSPRDEAALDRLFAKGHLAGGTYHLAGYPDKGPRAIMKIGYAKDLSPYLQDAGAQGVGGNWPMPDPEAPGLAAVAEVWWFHGSPTADDEWHEFMQSFAEQLGQPIFFAPVKAALKVGPLDFSKPRGTALVTLTLPLS